MRKGQRFTAPRLERWARNGRGTGVGENYQPWHQITRDDPGSLGRSHLINWKLGRLHHLLSDQEQIAFLFATMLPNVVDIREQFPLSNEEHIVELADYRADLMHCYAPGSLSIAAELKIKHPVVRGRKPAVPWVMSTDLLLTLKMPNSQPSLLAICVKYDHEIKGRRKRDLLKIEREYWRRQDVYWILFTPSLYDLAVATSIRTGMIWVIEQDSVSPDLLARCHSLKNEIHGKSLTSVLRILQERLNVSDAGAQQILWQSVWKAILPIDLSRPAWASAPIEIIDFQKFWDQNPIASRRTKCLP